MRAIHFIFLGFTFVSTLLGLFFIFKQKGDKVANRFMGGLLLSFAYILFYSILYWSNTSIPSINFTYYMPLALLGPFFYLYLQRVLNKTKLKIKLLVHSIPIVYIIIFYGKYFVQVPKSYFGNNSLLLATDIILTIVLLFYAFLSYRLVKKVDKKDFDLSFWVNTISMAFAGITVSYVIYYVLYYANVLTSTQDYIIAFMEMVFISFVGYMAFMQPDIFNGKPIGKVIPFLKKYHKSGVSEEYSIMLKSRLINLINNEKIHLRSNIGLIDIAIAINVSRNHASQVINEQFNMSFYDFINKYRIVEAKKIITNNNDDSNLNLTEIAYTVGFNNRISFYKAFKKFTGFSPSQYLKTKIAS